MPVENRAEHSLSLTDESPSSDGYCSYLDGEGLARLLMCRASANGPLENAGYIASERVHALTLRGSGTGSPYFPVVIRVNM